MARKPRCPVCRSKRWHRDGLSGSIVCEEGHLLQGYVQESNETHELSQHVTTTRRLRKKRTKKVKPLPNLFFHGERGTFLLWQALQWVLREQLRVLIEELGWPAELEAVCRDLWAMLTASSGVPNAPADYLNGDEPATSYCGPRPGGRYTKRGYKRRKTTKGEDDDDDDAPMEDVLQDVDRTEGERGSGSEADDDSDMSDSSDDEAEPAEERAQTPAGDQDDKGQPTLPPANIFEHVKPPPPVEVTHRSSNPRSAPRIDHLLMVLYLGCVTLRLPVFWRDITYLVETHQILYINAKNHLPLSFQQHLTHEARYLLDPQAVPKIFQTSHPTEGLNVWLEPLVKMYLDDWGVRFPEPNLPLMSWRLCRSLALPPFFYSQLKALLSVIPHFTLALHPPPKHTRIAKNSTYNTFAESPEFVLVAGLIVLCKTVWGLTEETRQPLDERDLIARLPSVDRWLETLEKLARVDKEHEISAMWSKEVSDMTSNDVDAYLDFFEDKVVPEHQLPRRMKDVDRFFPAPALPARQHQDDNPAAIDRADKLINELYSLPRPVPPAQTEDVSSRPLPPYLLYHPSKVAAFPARLAAVLGHAARLVGTTSLEISHSLGRVEERVAVYPRTSRELGAKTRTELEADSRALRKEVEAWRSQRWEAEVERRKALKEKVEAAKGSGLKSTQGGSKRLAEVEDDLLLFKSKAYIDDSDEEADGSVVGGSPSGNGP